MTAILETKNRPNEKQTEKSYVLKKPYDMFHALETHVTQFGYQDVIIRWMCSFLQHRRQRVKIGDDVRLAGDGCWHAARIVSWAVDVHYVG